MGSRRPCTDATLICAEFIYGIPDFGFADVLPSCPWLYWRVAPSLVHVHRLSGRGVKHCTQNLLLPPYRIGHS